MVVPLKKAQAKAVAIKPAEFYGSSLPRPRIYTNPQFNPERVDPPLSVLDPLLSWARDAHWSMGGLSFTRLRLQGRIEGKVSKLRAQREKLSPKAKDKARFPLSEAVTNNKRTGSESPPAAPVAVKRRRFLDLNDEDDEIESEDEGTVRTRRKLSDDFDRVARESKIDMVSDGFGVGNDVMSLVEELNSDGKKKEKGRVKGIEQSGTRTSPRLAKRRLN